MELLLVTSVLLTLLLHPVAGSGWWMDQPYAEASDFNTDAEYEENVTLSCGDQVSGEFKHWVRPDMTVMEANSSEYFKVLYGSAGWMVDAGGAMHIVFVQEQHFGFYYCVVYNAPEYIYVKKALNYKGPYFGDLWETYEMNFIVGCSAAGGFLLACLVIFVVHHFCFRSEEDPDQDSNGSQAAVEVEDGYTSLRVPGDDPMFYPQKSQGAVENGAYVVGKEEKMELQAYTHL